MRESVIKWPLGICYKDLVGAGLTSTVARLDAVVKFVDLEDLNYLEREKLVYERLGRDHSGIVRYFGVVENAILLEFASHTSIRQYVTRGNQAPLSIKLRWVKQLFDAVQFIHSKGVLHSDISCNSVFLDKDLNIRLGDFGGSDIDRHAPLLVYETSHSLPGSGQDISTKTELFALCSTTYEIMTGLKPYNHLSDYEISTAFSEGRYPDLKTIPVLRHTIIGCWRERYKTIEEALREVKLEGTFNSLAKQQKLTVRLVATIKEPRHLRHFRALLCRESILFPFLLTVVSLVPVVGWVKRWRLFR